LLDRFSLGTMMSKILVMAQDVERVVEFIRQTTDAKVISESEIADSTGYEQGWLVPGYSDFIVTRTKNLIAAYKFSRPLAVVLNQRHQNAVAHVGITSIRVCDDVRPKRLSDAVSYKTDVVVTTAELTDKYFQQYFTI
jgi:hypothetical protein